MEIVKLRFTLLSIALLSVASTANDEALTRANSLSEQAQKITLEVEQEQLQKARDAAKQTQEREQKVLKRQTSGDWESEQIEKAQQQFKQRGSREDQYLREAREAANKQQKIPQPINP